MKDKIEVGEYIRTYEGIIAKCVDILPRNIKNIQLDNYYGYTMESIDFEDVKKHSKSIMDLIEKGDIFELEFPQKGKMTISMYDIENFKLELKKTNVKIKSILTHEQYEENCYKVEE